MITNGQARRIAAGWQAPGNAYSALQHVGRIEPTLLDEIKHDLHSGHTPDDARGELRALRVFARAHGVGPVPGWGAWDDTPADESEES